ncbi:dTDP-4-dehydrorhamnose 3,5-epimerase family protein, partial [Burkholderia anthina]
MDRRRAGAEARAAAVEERLRAVSPEPSHESGRMVIQVTATALPEVRVIEPKVFGDARGYFYESFNGREFAELVETGVEFVQDNHSRSAKG